jgi:hypothetical protein
VLFESSDGVNYKSRPDEYEHHQLGAGDGLVHEHGAAEEGDRGASVLQYSHGLEGYLVHNHVVQYHGQGGDDAGENQQHRVPGAGHGGQPARAAEEYQHGGQREGGHQRDLNSEADYGVRLGEAFYGGVHRPVQREAQRQHGEGAVFRGADDYARTGQPHGHVFQHMGLFLHQQHAGQKYHQRVEIVAQRGIQNVPAADGPDEQRPVAAQEHRGRDKVLHNVPVFEGRPVFAEAAGNEKVQIEEHQRHEDSDAHDEHGAELVKIRPVQRLHPPDYVAAQVAQQGSRYRLLLHRFRPERSL